MRRSNAAHAAARLLLAAAATATVATSTCPPTLFTTSPSVRGRGAVGSNLLAITADGLITSPAASAGEINADCAAAAVEHAGGVVSLLGGYVPSRAEYRWCLLLQLGGAGPGTMRAYFNTSALTSGNATTTVTCTPPAAGAAWPGDTVDVTGWAQTTPHSPAPMQRPARCRRRGRGVGRGRRRSRTRGTCSSHPAA